MMKTHPLDVSSLVVGLIFLGLAGAWALREAGVIDIDSAAWVLPLLLVAAGVIGIGATVLKNIHTTKKPVMENDDEHS